jgi:hypothetical protein
MALVTRLVVNAATSIRHQPIEGQTTLVMDQLKLCVETAGSSMDQVSVPNDVGFENYEWPTIATVRAALEDLGIGYGVKGAGPGCFYDYAGDPVPAGVGARSRTRRRPERCRQAA